MGLLRRKPFAFLATIIAFSLIILACITVQPACYDQVGIFGYSKINNEAYCEAECGEARAVKFVGFAATGNLAAVSNNQQFSPSEQGLRRIIRCPWKGTTNRLFLAFSSLLCLWLILELTLGAYRKYPVFLNLILLLVIGFGIPTAAYQMNDLHHTNCERDIMAPTGLPSPHSPTNAAWALCYHSLFNVSFIFTILAMVILLAQLAYNIIYRKQINEKAPQYSNINQQSAGTEPAQQLPADRAENKVV